MQNVAIFPLSRWGIADPEDVIDRLRETRETYEDEAKNLYAYASKLGRSMARMGIPRHMRQEALADWYDDIGLAYEETFRPYAWMRDEDDAG